ncbi:MAG: thiol reductant ABC exporter subunit CydC [Rhodobacter sp.]|nr:thiol reductant ABC exporter subunit CydC [Rhodobacter sp.]
MSALATILRLIWRDQRAALTRGAVLAVTVLVMGAALLGLSGWFITAAATAGLAGAGAVFDVFRPSAAVRFLALGRTAARYGERLATHDATLRALTSLRVRLLAAQTRAPFAALARLRASEALNRLGADVDALDAVTLRLALPVGAALAALILAAGGLVWLTDPRIALAVCGVMALGGGAALWLGVRAARTPARQAEDQAQAFRRGVVDLVSARADLAALGQLTTQVAQVTAADDRRRVLNRHLDRLGRRVGLALSLTGAAAMALALGIGGTLAHAGILDPARAAIGLFVALALAEAITPLRRTASEFGRMASAARRVAARLNTPTGPAQPLPADRTLALTGVTHGHHPLSEPVLRGIDLRLPAGTRLGLQGPSGSGKTTLLALMAGQDRPGTGRVTLGGRDLTDLDEGALRRVLTLVPQRSALIQGTVADNLRLAAPHAGEAELRAVLDAVHLSAPLAARGGLSTPLHARGAGLSGGESRRLALARALLRQPDILLLDEPTEGLDAATARAVMQAILDRLPTATIIVASHRPEDLSRMALILDLGRPEVRSSNL